MAVNLEEENRALRAKNAQLMRVADAAREFKAIATTHIEHLQENAGHSTTRLMDATAAAERRLNAVV